jgi:hypothetical protein
MVGTEFTAAAARRSKSRFTYITLFMVIIASVAGARTASAQTLAVSPTSVTLTPGKTAQFRATRNGAQVNATWRATGGSISSSGLFTAGKTTGTYSVTATYRYSTRTAQVVIKPARYLVKVSVSPATATLQPGTTQTFTATALWSDGTTSVTSAVWSASGGTITSTGVYTAGTTAGTYQVVAAKSGGTIKGTATVTVASATRTLVGVVVSPSSATVETGSTKQFSATANWSDGSTGALAVTWSATGGSVTSSGNYTAGSTPGTYEVKATQSGGTMSGRATVTVGAPASTTSCSVPGGTSSAPTALGQVLGAQTQCTDFVLEDGAYSATTITRPGITVRARNACQATIQPELSIQAANVVVSGVSVTASGVAVTVYSPGVHVENSCVQGFGKTEYGNGIWIFQEALNPANHIVISGNKLDNWGGAQYSGGIAIGMASDNLTTPTAISVEVLNNRITRGPTAPGIYNAAIQAFHPFLAAGNYVDTVSGTSVQNKTFNSLVRCNEMVHVIGDGALYNRLNSHNVWEYNRVHDSDVGIDHFMGDGNVFRGNVIYRVAYLGRVKDQGIGSTNLTFEGNTFYGSSAWAGFIWDASTGGAVSNVMWRHNIFHTVNGTTIASDGVIDSYWDETDNVFWQASRPSGTSGAGGTSRTLDPQFVNPGTDFTVQEPNAAGYGAPWPLACAAN